MREVVIDIETGRAPEEDIQAKIAAIEITQAAMKKGKTAMDKEYIEKEKTIRSKAQLLDTSPINCIGTIIDSHPLLLTTLDLCEGIEGVAIQHFDDEKTMLLVFKSLIESFEPEDTIIITFNGKYFDIPRILCRMSYHDIRKPKILQKYGCEHFDVKIEFGHYSLDHYMTISLDKAAYKLGLNGKTLLFEEAQAKLDDGDVRSFLMYNVLDLTLTYECYKRMI